MIHFYKMLMFQNMTATQDTNIQDRFSEKPSNAFVVMRWLFFFLNGFKDAYIFYQKTKQRNIIQSKFVELQKSASLF